MVVFEDDGPNVAKDRLDIENHEEHGDEVEFDRKAGGTVADGEHAALVSFVLHSFGFASLAEVKAHDEGDSCEPYGEDNLEEDREEIEKHGV